MEKLSRLLIALGFLALVGCAAGPRPGDAPSVDPQVQAVKEYRIGVDDQIRVAVWQNPDLNVTVPVLTLLGLDDEPADLEGYGPIDADTARRLAAHAPSLRRILVHPETGAVRNYGREVYRAPADLDGYVRVRDGQCRFPGCSRRAERADLDHTTAWAHGGETCAANLAVLCRHHHRLKHEAGWRVALEEHGIMRWTSPAGHVLRTLPERPFVPVGAGDGVDPPPGAPPVDAPVVPPDPIGSFDNEWQSLLERLAPVPF